MLDTIQRLLESQYRAGLCTLNACVDRCPEEAWDAPVANLAFCQVVFHTLFFADVYLGKDLESLKTQPFHRDHAGYFRDYEELAAREQRLLYDRPTTRLYLRHCLEKVSEVLAGETQESLGSPCGFFSLTINRAELHVYDIRHIQHHAAQLSLRLRLDGGDGVPWVGAGWRET